MPTTSDRSAALGQRDFGIATLLHTSGLDNCERFFPLY